VWWTNEQPKINWNNFFRSSSHTISGHHFSRFFAFFCVFLRFLRFLSRFWKQIQMYIDRSSPVKLLHLFVTWIFSLFLSSNLLRPFLNADQPPRQFFVCICILMAQREMWMWCKYHFLRFVLKSSFVYSS
jgi:hypothetical protein